MTPRIIIIANPGSKRWELYHQELSAFWDEQKLKAEVHLVPWLDVLNHQGDLSHFPFFDKPALVRLESPGRDFEVTKALLCTGDPDNAEMWNQLPYRKGHLLRPGILYRGFCQVLRQIDEQLSSRPHLTSLSAPLEILELFDKNVTLEKCRQADLPCPETLCPPEMSGQLLEMLHSERWRKTYVKLATGSSASGIAVVRGESAITSVVELNDGFYNTRRLRHVEGNDLGRILQFILDEGSTIQQGISMAQIDGQNFDVRVVMIHGQIAFTIFRLSPNPMTNLHLGGRRGEVEYCRKAIPRRAWLDAMDHCLEVAKVFPRSSILGIDLLFERGYLQHYLLEANAFGDFFPGWTNEQGKTIHRLEIEESARKVGWIS